MLSTPQRCVATPPRTLALAMREIKVRTNSRKGASEGVDTWINHS
jgi:hypothetical protein